MENTEGLSILMNYLMTFCLQFSGDTLICLILTVRWSTVNARHSKYSVTLIHFQNEWWSLVRFLTFECFNNHVDHSNETSLVSTDNFYIVVLLIFSILRINESWNSLIVWLWLLLKVDELIIFHVITILEDFITSFKKTMRQLSVDTCLVFYWMGDQAKY